MTLDSRSTADAVRTALADSILERELPPGWRLSEEWLATVFGVSRTPIREALAALAGSDLVSRDSRGSLRVNSITTDQVFEVFAVRKGLEGVAAGLAAEAASPKLIRELRQLNHHCADAVRAADFKELSKANLAFHAAIAHGSGNGLLLRQIQDIYNSMRRIPTLAASYAVRALAVIPEHDQIIDAIDAHDPVAAEQRAREHVETAERVLVENLVAQETAGDRSELTSL